MKEIRVNMEEIVLQGDECEQDVRMVNSYPSKVTQSHSQLLTHVGPVVALHGVFATQFGQARAFLEALDDEQLSGFLQRVDPL